MSQKEKELLLKDLCARLPYEPKARKDGMETSINLTTLDSFYYGDEIILPYLRRMSSMTEDEKKEFIKYAGYDVEESINGRHYEYYLKDYVGTSEKPICNCNAMDWLNAHHFDYRDLIEMGLALPAPEGMY